jgi:hypothetical protein
MSSTLTLSDEAGDCWADKFNNFDNSTSPLYVGDTNVAADRDVRTYMPFTVPLAKGTAVISATLKLVAAATSSVVTSTIQLSCEAADSVINPSSGADCRARAKTTATSNVTLNQYTNGVQVTYDLTAMVQEIINRSGWVSGNRLAVMIDDVNTTDKPHSVHSYEAGANKPVLEIVVPDFIPTGSGVI